MKLYLSRHNTFCFDVQYPDGTEGAITLAGEPFSTLEPGQPHDVEHRGKPLIRRRSDTPRVCSRDALSPAPRGHFRPGVGERHADATVV